MKELTHTPDNLSQDTLHPGILSGRPWRTAAAVPQGKADQPILVDFAPGAFCFVDATGRSLFL